MNINQHNSMIMASSLEVDDRQDLQETNTFQDNKKDEYNQEKKWRNIMMEKEQVFNIEFDSKVSANNFASNGNLNVAPNYVTEVKQGKRMMVGSHANTLEFMPKTSI
jgi:hypothetical protein